MPITFAAASGLLLLLGCTARAQGADASLRFFPALLLVGTPFVAGPDIPPHLTDSGIAIVYFTPGVFFLALGLFLWCRRSRGTTTS